MGVHMLNPSLLDGTVDADSRSCSSTSPGARQLKLVALEYLVFSPPGRAPPSRSSSVRSSTSSRRATATGCRRSTRLHAWVWEPNPSGT